MGRQGGGAVQRAGRIAVIALVWHERTTEPEADEYVEFLEKRAILDYESAEGNRAALDSPRNYAM